MKSTKQHYEEWKHVLPNFTEEQKRKLYFMMNDYARDYHKSEVKKFRLGDVVGRSEQLCPNCGNTGRRLPQTLDSPDGLECECGAGV